MESTMPTKEEYVKNLNDLYASIENWLKDSSIVFSQKDTALSESRLGDYIAPVLTLSDKKTKKTIAEIRPAGAQIIGARGRIDIVGAVDKQFLVYLTEVPEGKLRVTVTEKPFISSSTPSNWYWIDSMPLRRPHPITQSLFLDLITSVSDYDTRQHA